MIDKLLGPHADNLQRALSRTSDRFGLLSNNLANVNTPGYKRRDMDFGIVLEGELNRGERNQQGIQISDHAIRRDGNSVNLEQEVAAIAETEARYRLLTEMSSRYFSGLKSVIREGR